MEDELGMQQITWHITAKAGFHRGTSWTVGERPLVLGRSLSCDIVVSDPTVSRRHCQIALTGGRLHFEDLGSRNVTWINGEPLDRGYLEGGDELSVGDDVFFITCTRDTKGDLPPRYPSDDTTVSLGLGVKAKHRDRVLRSPESPASAPGMADLQHFSRELIGARSVQEFAARCLAVLGEHFPVPSKAYVCVRHNGGRFEVYPKGASLPERLRKRVGEVFDSGQGRLEVERRLRFLPSQQVAMSPLRVRGENRVAFVATGNLRDGKWDDTDLARLEMLADAAAPHVAAVLPGEVDVARVSDTPQHIPGEFIGESGAAAALRGDIEAAAGSRLHVLIMGEAGTGKTHVAELLHRKSMEPRGALIIAGCPMLSGDQFGPALLGEERRAGSGGLIIEAGLLDRANGGTLVLRDIETLSPKNQRLLAQVLARRAFKRLGSAAEVSFHGRVVATTSMDLAAAVGRDEFRSDLLQVLSRVRLTIPPLRQRRVDIRSLAQHFLSPQKGGGEVPATGLTRDALGYLQKLPWRGNASELKRALSNASHDIAGIGFGTLDLDGESKEPSGREAPTLEPLEHTEHMLIAAVVRQCGGDVNRAAEILGIARTEVERVSR